MYHLNKKVRYDAAAAATAQYYNTTGNLPSYYNLSVDVSYLITTQPNCTIVVFELPQECTEIEINNLFSSYGPIKNLQRVCGGKAALVEFTEISLPTRLVHWAKINPFFVGSTHVRLEFSSQTIAAMMPTANPTLAQSSIVDSKSPTILHLIIKNADYPITVDVLKAICSLHGRLQKIFIGPKNLDKSIEALVEFSDADGAKKALENLNGADIYSGCCNLTVAYSKTTKVHITKNDTESWDFTNSTDNSQTNASMQRTLLGPTNSGNADVPMNATGATAVLPPVATITSPATAAPPVAYQNAPYYNYSMPQGFPTPYMPTAGSYYYPSVMPGQVMPAYSNAVAAYAVQSTTPSFFPNQSSYPMYPSSVPYNSQLPVKQSIISNPQIVPSPAATHNVDSKGIGIGHSASNLSENSTYDFRNTDLSIFKVEEGTVLSISNLPERINCDNLFNLLCLYGNIARIKISKNMPGHAFVQMGSREAAEFVCSYMEGTAIFGHTIQYQRTEKSELQEELNLGLLTDGTPVMKNYMSDPNNRFRNAVVASKSRILLPTKTLHFFNSPLNLTPNDICRVFTDASVKKPSRIVMFSSKPGQKTALGLVEWESISEALETLALVNHQPISIVGIPHPFHMKLAFSPKPITDDRIGSNHVNFASSDVMNRSDISGQTGNLHTGTIQPADNGIPFESDSANAVTLKRSIHDSKFVFNVEDVGATEVNNLGGKTISPIPEKIEKNKIDEIDTGEDNHHSQSKSDSQWDGINATSPDKIYNPPVTPPSEKDDTM